MVKRVLVVGILAVAVIAAIPFLFDRGPPRAYQGWVEADMLFIGAETVGRLADIHVDEGATLTAGQPLFRLDTTSEDAAVTAARATLAGAQAELDLARAAQKRPQEMDVLKAAEREAVARLELSVQELDRTKELVRQGTGTRANLDVATATETANRAALDSARSETVLGALPAREENIREAEEATSSARADLASAEAMLAKRSVSAPAAATIQTIYYRKGEVVPVGRPVVSLLPPENIRIRFFVPETDIAGLSLNQPVRVTCDGCEPAQARISFIADEAEFTPPVIFSNEERSKLVYKVEAIPDRPQTFRPGLPVDVVPEAGS